MTSIMFGLILVILSSWLYKSVTFGRLSVHRIRNSQWPQVLLTNSMPIPNTHLVYDHLTIEIYDNHAICRTSGPYDSRTTYLTIEICERGPGLGFRHFYVNTTPVKRQHQWLIMLKHLQIYLHSRYTKRT